MVLRTGQNKCSNHIESGFLHENASAKTTTIKIVCEKWGLGYHYLSGKAMVFPLVIYRCESWTIKKAEHWRTDAFKLWCQRRLLRIPWTRRSNQSILKEINLEYSLEGLMLKLKLQDLGHLMQRVNSLGKKTLKLGKIEDWRREQQRMG